MSSHFHPDWAPFLQTEFKKAYFLGLADTLKTEYASQIVYPARKDVFNAFRFTSPEKTKVLILGQDPYHNPNEAHGLCFSVPQGIKIPPSLQNIFKELASDSALHPRFYPPSHGDLSGWANQGVLLLNAGLTVRANQPNSHSNLGWQTFTDHVISYVSEVSPFTVFLLWGSFAQSKKSLINPSKHAVLTAPHPSPLSAYRGFLGCKHFSQTNALLQQKGISPINWNQHI
jgi:uracil-DNA glycosylase